MSRHTNTMSLKYQQRSIRIDGCHYLLPKTRVQLSVNRTRLLKGAHTAKSKAYLFPSHNDWCQRTLICLPRGVIEFRLINLILYHHLIMFPYKSLRNLRKNENCVQESLHGLTGCYKVLYDILFPQIWKLLFYFLLYCSHFVIPMEKRKKICIKKMIPIFFHISMPL